MQNFEERLRMCVQQEGRHLSDIIIRNWVINVSNQNCFYYTLFWCWHNFFILKINKVTVIWKRCVLFAPPGIFYWFKLWGNRKQMCITTHLKVYIVLMQKLKASNTFQNKNNYYFVQKIGQFAVYVYKCSFLP